MKLKRLSFAATAILFSVVAGPVLAAAPDVHATGVDLRPMLQELLLTAGSVLMVLAMWALRKIGAYVKSKTGVNILEQESILRKYMEGALQSGLKYGATQVDKASWAKVDTKNEVLNHAADYVLKAVPGAISHFGLDREALIERLKARFPDLEETLAAAAAQPALVPQPAKKTA